MSEEEDAIRLRAYWLWEQEGRPKGRHDDHWKQACDELATAAQITRGADSPAIKRKTSRPTGESGRAKGRAESPKSAPPYKASHPGSG